MNQVILIGRLTRDPDSRLLDSGISLCRFNLAVDRKFKNAGGERESDFISCVAWRQTAEFIAKHFAKGSKMALSGTIQTRSYDKDGEKRYATEVITDSVEFVEKRGDHAPDTGSSRNTAQQDDFVEVDDSELPF